MITLSFTHPDSSFLSLNCIRHFNKRKPNTLCACKGARSLRKQTPFLPLEFSGSEPQREKRRLLSQTRARGASVLGFKCYFNRTTQITGGKIDDYIIATQTETEAKPRLVTSRPRVNKRMYAG